MLRLLPELRSPWPGRRAPCGWLRPMDVLPTPWIEGELGAQRRRQAGPRSQSKSAVKAGRRPQVPASQAHTSPAPLGAGPHHPRANTQVKRLLPRHCTAPLLITRRWGHPAPLEQGGGGLSSPRHPSAPEPQHALQAITAPRPAFRALEAQSEVRPIPHPLAESGHPTLGTHPAVGT